MNIDIDMKDILILVGRIITIFPLLLIMALFMGKRAIGELPVFDFLIIVSLAAVAGADIADPKIGHVHTAIAIVLIGIFQRVISKWAIQYRWFGKLITFEPTLVIRNGQFLIKNMKKIRYSLDNLLQMLRENGVFDVRDVELAIIEANGKLTVQQKKEKEVVTNEDMGITKKSALFSFPVIVEGRIYQEVLDKLKLDEAWLLQQMKEQGIHHTQEVFFASLTENRELHISLKTEKDIRIPPILH
ncbi:DUF421 domain-containing protein [Caldalkalibacillus mannanilyticus]|uniref:DUF421 domain-containing protein n=1 Tax=Caldalkalibacillus mannanilyticus TaxID=1418 RepID=UPI000AA88521|nr:DUF421 domain-containing protein [Caldalkalibacillus mannanilyticus]